MNVPLLEGVRSETITTQRLTTRVLFAGPDDGEAVLFLHGNASSATWWEETMVALPDGFLGIALDQRGFGASEIDMKVDATRGTLDWVEDALVLLDHLGIAKAHVVGCSLGGCVLWRLLAEAPDRLLSVVFVDTGSPFGFGGTKDIEGSPCHEDFAGSGGGLSNPEFIRLLIAQDRSMDSPFSPRLALRTLVVKPPFIPEREEDLLTSMFSTHFGEQDNPGDHVPSANWPFVAPGKWGSANALSPKYAGDVQSLYDAQPKVRVLWIRGSHDLAVSDTASSDPGYLGKIGLIPGWPGDDIYPPQPMLGQTRAVLEKYAQLGGSYREVVIEDAAHVPFIEKPEEFNTELHAFLRGG